jgi:signal transduction histidine kinase
MDQRARRLGGSLVIESDEEQGTCVIVKVPFRP